MAEPTYRKLFDPEQPAKSSPTPRELVADRAPPEVFQFDEKLVLAINIALATGRPLLLRGASGVGKSSVARAVAWHERWSYVQITVTSRTLARDFLYQVDDLLRLQDAYAGRQIDDMRRYLVPGPLFWAFDPDYARSILASSGRGAAISPDIVADAANTVVLIDEIDKADPDVPNNLLEPLGRLSFEAPELPRPVTAPASRVPLVLLTTNEERDLPKAFLRRCIEHRIEPPTPERMRSIGEAHFGHLDEKHHQLVMRFAPTSPAEYLDAIRACRRLADGRSVLADIEAIVRAGLGQQSDGGTL
jgi:MoxR-like ATPase